MASSPRKSHPRPPDDLPDPSPLQTLDNALQQVLRMGLYETLHLNQKGHVCNQHVDLAKTLTGSRGAAGLVNAVLRTANRLKEEGVLLSLEDIVPLDAPGEVEGLAIEHSHPTWIVRRWVNMLG